MPYMHSEGGGEGCVSGPGFLSDVLTFFKKLAISKLVSDGFVEKALGEGWLSLHLLRLL